MAILQFSRITHRRGLAENLPQLSGGELGWALDERKLYIGNGTIEEGAPVIGNTEILTEFSDILNIGTAYTYKGDAAGYVVATGPNGEAIVRSLQSKFDDRASIKDFGAVGDGATDDTAAINRALYELFCREPNPETRRSLFFPAGTYLVSDTIKVPPHAKLTGEGLTSSIIHYKSATIPVTDFVVGERYAVTSVGTTDFTLIGGTNVVDAIFVATAGTPTGTGTIRKVTETVLETSDSLHQTGASIGNNGATAPAGIEVSSMSVYSDEDNTLLRVDSANNCGFSYLGLHGSRQSALLSQTVGNATAAVEVKSTVQVSHDITISKIDSLGTTYGLLIEDEVKGVVYENSGLDFHYIGCNIDKAGANSPTGVIITRNIFDNIARQGIFFGLVDFNSSAFNVFYDVANNFSVTPQVPVIQMDGPNCVSFGDLFQRTDAEEDIQPRIGMFGNGGIAFDSTHSMHLGTYERLSGIVATLADNTTAGTVFNVASDAPNSFKVEYTLTRGTETRTGLLTVSNSGAAMDFNEEYTESNAMGVTFNVVATGASSELTFDTTATGTDARLSYSIIKLL